MKSILIPLLFLYVSLFGVLSAPAAEIVALVIGNNAYARADDVLSTPVADAELMQRTLAALPGGADVKILRNASKEDIEIALNSLKVRARGAKLALVFYSGHGMDGQPDGFPQVDTFLLPVEAEITDVNYLDTRAVSLTKVLAALRDSPVTARAVILDCCRTGAPKATAALTGSTKDAVDLDERVKAALGKATVPEATLVAFAASPGRPAAAFLRDSDINSPFTKFLAGQLSTGTGNLRDLVEAAAVETERNTERRQVPYVEYKGAASAIHQIVFRGTQALSPVPLTPQPVPQPAVPLPSAVVESYAQFAGKSAGERRVIEVASGVGIPFRWCPPGTFMMGSPAVERRLLVESSVTKTKEMQLMEEMREMHKKGDLFFENETEHEVTLTHGFWLAETEVTQGQWKGVIGTTLLQQANAMLSDETQFELAGKLQTMRAFKNARVGEGAEHIGVEADNMAMYYVNWQEAVQFCASSNRYTRLADWQMKLPTEAQWEYACRAGTVGMTYEGDFAIKGKHNAPGLDPIAWYGGNSSVGYSGVGFSTDFLTEKQYPGMLAGVRRVGAKKANMWGLFDMIGNVYEWTGDGYGEYPVGKISDPKGILEGSERVFRGGSWDGAAALCRAAYRDADAPGIRSDFLGFRPAIVYSVRLGG